MAKNTVPGKPTTVKQLIEILSKLDGDLPVYIRAKYTKDVIYTLDYPMLPHNVCEMHPNAEIYKGIDAKKRVTILY